MKITKRFTINLTEEKFQRLESLLTEHAPGWTKVRKQFARLGALAEQETAKAVKRAQDSLGRKASLTYCLAPPKDGVSVTVTELDSQAASAGK